MKEVRYKVNGCDVSEKEFRAWIKKRNLRLRHAGCSLEDGLAQCKAPSILTDDEFINHHHNEHPEFKREQIAIAARRAGLREDVFYDPTLADSPMDPKAMFTSRADWKRKVEDVRSRINNTDHSRPVHRLHPRLVQEEIQRRASENPDVLRRDRRELAEEIIDKHGTKG